MATIYIVEDDVNIREIETFSLKNSGYTVMDFECAKDFYHNLSVCSAQIYYKSFIF